MFDIITLVDSRRVYVRVCLYARVDDVTVLAASSSPVASDDDEAAPAPATSLDFSAFQLNARTGKLSFAAIAAGQHKTPFSVSVAGTCSACERDTV
jgi:hypothetical protein